MAAVLIFTWMYHTPKHCCCHCNSETMYLMVPKGFAASVLVFISTGVCVLMGQSCFYWRKEDTHSVKQMVLMLWLTDEYFLGPFNSNCTLQLFIEHWC